MKQEQRHIAHARVEHYLVGGYFWTNVSFESADEVQKVIEQLQYLKDAKDGATDAHVHLQDYSLTKNSRAAVGEIVFELMPKSNLWHDSDRAAWAKNAERAIESDPS